MPTKQVKLIAQANVVDHPSIITWCITHLWLSLVLSVTQRSSWSSHMLTLNWLMNKEMLAYVNETSKYIAGLEQG